MSWTHFSDTTPRARKRYRCVLCNEFIEVGETHVARRGTDEEGPLTCRMHTECEAATQDWSWDDWDLCSGNMERPRKVGR